MNRQSYLANQGACFFKIIVNAQKVQKKKKRNEIFDKIHATDFKFKVCF